MVLLIIIPIKNGYFIGNIPNIFRQTQQMLTPVDSSQAPYSAMNSWLSPMVESHGDPMEHNDSQKGDSHGDGIYGLVV